MRPVYRFRSDSALAKSWQQSEVGDGMYKHPFGLPGTASWWEAIEAGKLPVKTVEDVVVSYRPPGDEPGKSAYFTLADGSAWIASDERGRLMIYQNGQRVRVQYVTLEPNKSWAKEHRLILEIDRDNKV